MQGICGSLDLHKSPKPEDIHVWGPEELLVILGVREFVFYLYHRIVYVVQHSLSVSRFHLLYLTLVVENGVFENLGNILLSYLWWAISR